MNFFTFCQRKLGKISNKYILWKCVEKKNATIILWFEKSFKGKILICVEAPWSRDAHEWQDLKRKNRQNEPQNRAPQYFNNELLHTRFKRALSEDFFSPHHLSSYTRFDPEQSRTNVTIILLTEPHKCNYYTFYYCKWMIHLLRKKKIDNKYKSHALN